MAIPLLLSLYVTCLAPLRGISAVWTSCSFSRESDGPYHSVAHLMLRLHFTMTAKDPLLLGGQERGQMERDGDGTR